MRPIMRNLAAASSYRMLLQVALLLCALASPLSWAQTPQTSGQWQLGPNFPFFPVHMHVLPDSTVMMWPGDGGVSGDDPRVWNPGSGIVTSVSRVGYDTFCSGHSFLPDGRLFVAGGHISNNVGLPDAAIYNPVSNTWLRQPDMNLGRWYPTTTTLPNGDVLVVAGDVDLSTGTNPLPQVWQSDSGTWRNLTSAQISLTMYPSMFLAPNGSVFNAAPGTLTRYLNTAGAGAWSSVGNRTFNALRDYGGAVMYEPGKILLAGGGDPPTATSEVIDLNATTPSWRAVGSMATARRQMNATMLPNGTVFASGGTRGAGFSNSDPGMPVLSAEIWNPATEAWSTMASATVPRLYHSIAMLLPDARILVTGGNGYTQTEIFSPPYLFAGARPSISSTPATVGKGQTFFVGTPDATGITGVTWIALPSLTHTNNMNQGFFRSTSITQATGGINIVAPNNVAVPSGYYMLFLLRNGVPSTAKMIQLGAPNNPMPSVSSLTPSSATAGGPAFSLSVNGSNFISASRVRWNGVDRPTTMVSATQLTAAISASDIAAAGTAQVSVFNPAPGGGTSLALAFAINAAPPPPPPNPVPALASIAPSSAAAGGGAFTLTATGTNFVLGSQVRWNGAARSTTFVSATQLTAAIPASDVQAAGTAQVSVFSPTPGGGTSAIQNFTITAAGNPVPALSSLTPADTVAGGSGFTLTVNGANFVTGSRVRWNGADRVTTFVSATQIRAAIPATDIATAGTAQVGVFNPTPGGGTSAVQSFTIAPAQNLSALGTVIARVTAPQGGGSRNIQIIRDGVMPPVGSTDSARQYDTWDGANTAADDWIGYQYASARTFNRVVFQEGGHFPDGGWFTSLTVQVRQGGNWVNVAGLAVTPAYPASNNNISYETYTLQFNAISGDAIRIYGNPGGSADFISVAELQVHGAGDPPPPPGQNLTALGTVIAKITAPLGGGSRNIQIIRDGVMPPVGSTDSALQYDTWDGANTAADDWIGYQYASAQTFNRVVFQEGKHFPDGGWFTSLTVQVRQGGNWVNVSGLAVTPAYPASNNNTSFETYTLQFTPVSGDAIRIFGVPGGSAAFITVGELQIFGP
ncbi:MAG: DUF1929 domain-containing protein [Variovorax sp.]|nr:MAG: DUF1929 domain-containing protein [Variovorax sp.]